jgi:hypothetical protein
MMDRLKATIPHKYDRYKAGMRFPDPVAVAVAASLPLPLPLPRDVRRYDATLGRVMRHTQVL